MARKTTSLKIDEQIWKKAKMNCLEKDIDLSEYIENLIKKDLEI